MISNSRYNPAIRIDVTPEQVARCEDFARRVSTDDKVSRYKDRNRTAAASTQSMDHSVGKIGEVAIETHLRTFEARGLGRIIKPPDLTIHHGFHDSDLIWETASGVLVRIGVKTTPWDRWMGWVFEQDGISDSGIYLFCTTTPTDQRVVRICYKLEAVLVKNYTVPMRRVELRKTKIAVYPWKHWEKPR